MEAAISKESSYKCNNIQYRPEDTPLKVAKANFVEVPSEKKPEVKTQKLPKVRLIQIAFSLGFWIGI